MRDLVSDRANRLEGSSTILVNQKADELRRKGIDVISLAVGEPDFNTPDFVKEACKKAIDENFTRYTPSPGIPELREAIAKKSRDDNQIPCKAGDVIVSPTKLGLFAAVSSLVNPGEEVLLTDPCFVSYAPQVKFNGGTPVYVPLSADNNWGIRADDVAERITKKTKLIMLCSPSNPTGGIDDPAELKAIVDLANDHDFAIISDEIYEKLVYEGRHVSPASLPGGYERTITINGLSKSFAMTGWRIGWVIAPEPFYTPISKIQTQSITHITSFVQKAAVTAIQGPQDSVRNMRDEFKARRDLLLNEIKTIPGWSATRPAGAFYLWPTFNQKMTSVELCNYLLEEAHVALVPGSAFGPASDRNVRISYAASTAKLTEAMRRIRDAMQRLERKPIPRSR
jgi:aspartate aminotransferase